MLLWRRNIKISHHSISSGMSLSFVQNLAPKLCFLNDELHIILARRNLEIGEHSSFFQLLTKFSFKSTLEF